MDETNEDTSYTRNYLRREIMPRLSAGVNTASARHLARFADYCAEADRYLEKAAEEALYRCLAPVRGPGVPEVPGIPADQESAAPGTGEAAGVLVLKIGALEREDPYIRKRVLYRALCTCADSDRSLGAVHVEAAEQLCRGQESARPPCREESRFSGRRAGSDLP